MAIPNFGALDDLALPQSAAMRGDDPQAHLSAVSWSAILAGAVGSAALSLILLILGTGIGLSLVSPWSGVGISATAFGVTTVVWLTFTQLLASGMGGYLAGRLRTKWVSAHTDEVYFRATAHGFLSWAVASQFSVHRPRAQSSIQENVNALDPFAFSGYSDSDHHLDRSVRALRPPSGPEGAVPSAPPPWAHRLERTRA